MSNTDKIEFLIDAKNDAVLDKLNAEIHALDEIHNKESARHNAIGEEIQKKQALEHNELWDRIVLHLKEQAIIPADYDRNKTPVFFNHKGQLFMEEHVCEPNPMEALLEKIAKAKAAKQESVTVN